MRLRSILAVALAGLALAFPAAGQNWPAKPLRLVVPFPPGGVTDVVARAVARHMGDELGQPVVVDNKPGAGGRVGTEAVKSASDGHTVLLMTSGTHSILPVIDAKLAFDAEADFTPIVLLMATPFVLHVNPSVPAKTLAEFIALAKARPGTLNYGSAGTGTAHHMFFELFKNAAKIDVTHVPYRGESPAMVELIAGQVQAVMAAGGKQYVDSGKTRALVTTGSKRWFLMPDVPSMTDANLPSAAALGWAGLMAPAGTPPEVAAKMNAAANRALAREDVKKILLEQGYDVLGGTPAELTASIRRDAAMWRKLVAETGLKFE